MIIWTFLLLVFYSETTLSSSCIDASKWINALGGYRVEVSNQNFDSTIVSFTCAEGYYLIGVEKLNCYRGILNGSLPLCVMDIGLNGIPSQSSGNSPYYAINSDLMTCSQTLETDPSPWWMLDLLEVIEISAIRIVLTHHRIDQIMVESMEVRIGNSSNYRDNPICAFLIQDDKEVNENDTIVIPCSGARGRYVSLNSVNTEHRFLILCKVLVLVDPSKYIHPKQCLSPNEGHLYHQRLTRFKVVNGRCLIWRRGKKSLFLEARDFCEKRGLQLPITSLDLKQENVRDSILVRWLSHHFEYKNSPRSFTWVSYLEDSQKGYDVKTTTTTSTTSTSSPSQKVIIDCWALDTANAWKWNLRPCESKAHVVCVSNPKTCVNPDVQFGTRIKEPHSFWIENKRPWLTGTTILYECINKSQTLYPEHLHKRTCSPSGHWTGSAPSCKDSIVSMHQQHIHDYSSSLVEDHSLFKDHYPVSDPSLARDIEIEIQGEEIDVEEGIGGFDDDRSDDESSSLLNYSNILDDQELSKDCENGTCSSYLYEDGNTSHFSSHSSSKLQLQISFITLSFVFIYI